MPADYYELLGVSQSASAEELKRAYRRLARECHPDTNPGDDAAEARFKDISEAYAVLSDSQARERYDRFGHDGLRGGAGFDFDLSSIFDSFFGHDPFATTSRRGPAGPPRGNDQEVVAKLEFAEAVFGAETKVSLRSAVVCEDCEGQGAASGTSPVRCGMCDGSGQVRQVRNSLFGRMITTAPCERCGGMGEEIPNPCSACHGGGVQTVKVTHAVKVPAGVEHGSILRLGGLGHAGSRGGPPGDLFVHLEIVPSRRFVRNGQDLVAEVNVTMLQAALGARLKFETLDGEEEVNIKPGTQPGDVLRLRGLGVPKSRGRGRGDLLLGVVVEIPRKLSSKQTKLLAEAAELLGDETT